jgi:hypothetical protein
VPDLNQITTFYCSNSFKEERGIWKLKKKSNNEYICKGFYAKKQKVTVANPSQFDIITVAEKDISFVEKKNVHFGESFATGQTLIS